MGLSWHGKIVLKMNRPTYFMCQTVLQSQMRLIKSCLKTVLRLKLLISSGQTYFIWLEAVHLAMAKAVKTQRQQN